MARACTVLLALLISACFGSHSSHPPRDAGADTETTPACWPPAVAPGVVPCDVPLEGLDDPCQCEGTGTCVIYNLEWPTLKGYCYRRPLAPSPCRDGLTLNYDQRLISLPPDQQIAEHLFRSYCVPPEDCLRVRAEDSIGPDVQCIYGDFTVAETGHVPAPSCDERPGGLMLCSAGCTCDPGYECGPYSERHAWAPCYPTGDLVPSMPFDGAWMTRVLTPEQARLNEDRTEAERHYVDRDYCPAVAAAFPGLYACDALPAPAP